jgi:hypothetical protein
MSDEFEREDWVRDMDTAVCAEDAVRLVEGVDMKAEEYG